MSKVIGIDLGTTNSVVAFLENGRPVVLQNTEGHKTTPSMVHYSDGEEVIVGDLARRQRITDPGRVLYSIKRFMGCRFEESPEKMDGINYNIEPDSEEMAAVRIGARLLRPEEISAEILIKMVETAEAYLGEEVGNAVITVPAHFNDSQRQATKKAAELAGLNCLRIINEPTAAALAYGLNKEKRQKVAVFDFGGGTFDISILDIDGDIFEVKATGGDNLLGGDNINHLLVEWMADLIREETGVDPRADLQAKQRIAETAEKVKCELSSMQKTLISLPFIVADESGPKHFSREISRDELNELIKPLLERLAPPCDQAMSDAGVRPDDLDAVILVGGSTRIPAVRALVETIFKKKPNTSMNPDEAVACGAAIQSAILSGHLQELLLLDVTPLSLGIELAGNVFSPLIPRNSNIPVTISKKFTTVVDNQSAVRVHVLQGERKIATENRSLAVFSLEGIPSAPKEIPEIEVQFHIDANGILTVSAMDLTSGVTQEVLVESYTAIATEEDAEDVLLDAEGHADEDRLHLRFASIRRRVNEMENILKAYKQKGNPLSEEQELQAREAFFRLEVAMARSDAEAVDEAERQAKTVFMEITSLMALRATDDTNSDFLKADFKPQPLESPDAEEIPEPSDSSPGR